LENQNEDPDNLSPQPEPDISGSIRDFDFRARAVSGRSRRQ
jgi:hypothetical protein